MAHGDMTSLLARTKHNRNTSVNVSAILTILIAGGRLYTRAYWTSVIMKAGPDAPAKTR